MPPLSNTVSFIEKATALHGDTYDYSSVVYINNHTKISIICKTHGEFEQRPADHLRGKGCTPCSRIRGGIKHASTSNSFIERAVASHGDTYDYTDVVYISSQTKVKILCKTHGSFYQRPTDHILGVGCPKCATASRALLRVSTLDTFIINAQKIHGEVYEYSNVTYGNNRTKVKIMCKTHGEFQQRPYSHLDGRGCPACASTGFDILKPGILYYLHIDNSVYKIGVTNRSIKQRFLASEVPRIKILEELTFADGKQCYDKEQEILRKYKEHKYIGPPVLKSGNTEMFNVNLLEHYGVTSVLEL